MSRVNTTESRPSRGERHAAVTAWFGVLMGPAAWALQLIGNWTMGEVIACAPASRHSGTIFGLRINATAAILNGTLIGLTVLAGILSYRNLRSRPRSDERGAVDPWSWLARAGLLTSALFTIVIATSFVPIALIGGCG